MTVRSLACALVVMASVFVASSGATAAVPTEEATAQPAQVVSVQLAAGGTLSPGDSLRSADGRYELAMQRDGNAVVYRGSRVLWASGTSGHPGTLLAVQHDGNLVAYAPTGRPVWATRTFGRNAVLAMQTDGNLVLYHGPTAVWASGPDRLPQSDRSRLAIGEPLLPGQSLVAGDYHLTLATDGNLVGGGPYGPGWTTSTAGQPVAHLVLQRDGNLVLYARDGRALWASGTAAAVELVLQSDARLTLNKADGGSVWSRRIAFAPSSRPLTDQEKVQMTGMSWHTGCPVPLSDLRRVSLTFVNFHGEPEDGALIVHKNVAGDAIAAFADLHAQRFPIRRMNPNVSDDNVSMAEDNTSAFNCRRVTGGTSWSRHAYGTAIDINPVENPYVTRDSVQPPAGAAYVDRSNVRPGMLVPGPSVRAFESRGWRWGGRWSSPIDYQHVEK